MESKSPHRKLRFNLSISLQILVGRRVHCMIWVGMAVVTELIRVKRSAMEREFAFQLASLSLNLLMMKSEDLIFLLSRRIGAPRYFPKFLVKDI